MCCIFVIDNIDNRKCLQNEELRFIGSVGVPHLEFKIIALGAIDFFNMELGLLNNRKV